MPGFIDQWLLKNGAGRIGYSTVTFTARLLLGSCFAVAARRRWRGKESVAISFAEVDRVLTLLRRSS